MAPTQKQTRVIKVLDEIKRDMTHALHQKEKSDFVIKIEGFKTAAGKSESGLPDVYKHAKAYLSPLLGRVPEATREEVKSQIHRIDLIITGRRS